MQVLILCENALIGQIPSVLESIVVSNRTYQGMSDAAIKDQIERLRRNWNAAEPDSALKS